MPTTSSMNPLAQTLANRTQDPGPGMSRTPPTVGSPFTNGPTPGPGFPAAPPARPPVTNGLTQQPPFSPAPPPQALQPAPAPGPTPPPALPGVSRPPAVTNGLVPTPPFGGGRQHPMTPLAPGGSWIQQFLSRMRGQ